MAGELENKNIVTLTDKENKRIAQTRLNYLTEAPHLALLCIITDALYIVYRITLFMGAGTHTSTNSLFLFVEIFNALATCLFNLQTASALGKAKLRLPRRLEGDDVPDVDILIPCCGEDPQLIAETLMAVLSIDYPTKKYRAFLLDDKDDARVKGKVDQIAKCGQQDNLFYTSRKKRESGPKFAKAGNLNHGLEFLANLGPAEFVAVLDVDMIPERAWLRTVLVDLLTDAQVALAIPPQRYYNIPNADPFTQNMSFFMDALEPIKDCVSSTWCTGSGYVMRREALDQIGWFPNDTDVITSVYLAAAGWKLAYVHEDMQWGLVASSIHDHIVQQKRWSVNGLYTIKSLLNVRAEGATARTSRIGPLIACVAGILTILVSGLSILLVPFLLIRGSQILEYQTLGQLKLLLFFECLSFGATLTSNYAQCRAANFTFQTLGMWNSIPLVPHKIQAYFVFCFPDITVDRFRSLIGLPSKSTPGKDNYRPSNAPRDDVEERTGTEQFHLFYLSTLFCVCLFGGVRALQAAVSQPEQHRIVFWATRGGFPPFALLWMKYLFQAWKQLYPMTFSKTVWPSRRSFISCDDHGIERPSPWATQVERTQVSQLYSAMAVVLHLGIVGFGCTL